VVGMSVNSRKLPRRIVARRGGEVPVVSVACVEAERALGFGR